MPPERESREPASLRYLFEDYALDTDRRELQRGGAPVPLEPQVFDLLAYLVEQRDRVVSKDDLLAAVWNGRIVSESALTTRINAARRAIGDSGDAQRLIRTLRGRGIRFVGTVREETAAEAITDPGVSLPSADRFSIAVSPLTNTSGAPLSLPRKPSIAVLPFTILSDDPEQQYFADGVVEDIITALSRFKSLFVIARNSSFTYRGKAVDIKQVGRELGVRYVLEGSVRKSADKVRINGQLIDSTTGAHLWADRFEGKLKDVFELQDQITTNVVGELITNVEVAEIERARRKPSTSLDAYDCYWKGLAEYWKISQPGSDDALAYFLKAIDFDENFASAYGFAATTYAVRWQNRWMVNVAQERAEAVRLARLAIELGQSDEVALSRGGFVLAAIAGELDFGAECARRSLMMNPNYAIGWLHSAWISLYSGDHQTVRANVGQFERLSPRAPTLFQGKLAAAFAHVFEGHYKEAAYLAEQLTHELPSLGSAWRVLAMSRALAGDVALANIATKKMLELDPSLRVPAMASTMPLRRAVDVERLKEGYLLAGFPP
jgi:TolB-like protein